MNNMVNACRNTLEGRNKKEKYQELKLKPAAEDRIKKTTIKKKKKNVLEFKTYPFSFNAEGSNVF